jgi:ADP-heptose:LPS heptosyltransferase
VASGIAGAISSAGCLSLRGTAALIGRMALFITNDTGPMHIAFALKTPTIALFSPTDPALCGPYKAEKALALRKDTTCVPCIGKKCYNPLCLAQISPREVVVAAEKLLGSRDNR